MVGRVDEHERTTAGVQRAHHLLNDMLKRLLRIQRGMNDVADALKQLKTMKSTAKFLQFRHWSGVACCVFSGHD